MSSKYKRPGYAAAYKRLRLSQAAHDNKTFSWIGRGFLYVGLALLPIIYFQILSFLIISIK